VVFTSDWESVAVAALRTVLVAMTPLTAKELVGVLLDPLPPKLPFLLVDF